jgi:hypothetical protein
VFLNQLQVCCRFGSVLVAMFDASHTTCSTECPWVTFQQQGRLMMNTPGCKSAKVMIPAVDRISGLPDELLHHVMSFLSAEDVRTCVLSPRWHHLWPTARSLKLGAKGFTTERIH